MIPASGAWWSYRPEPPPNAGPGPAGTRSQSLDLEELAWWARVLKVLRNPWHLLVVALFPHVGWAEAPVPSVVSFRNDVLPILGGNGCSTGSCHAKQGGQNGFQLTIFGFDPAADYREITRNARGRRIFPAAPEQSLLLLKATKQVDHEGGERIKPGSHEYKVLADWIRQGAPMEIPGEPSLTSWMSSMLSKPRLHRMPVRVQ